jgi:arylsulfatase A-like enzyme
MSFPDPHHPWDPPASEKHRVRWRDLDLPPGHPGSREKIVEVLRQKPRHWLEWYEGRFRNNEGGPMAFVPRALTHDQVREVNALVHIENELIDEACGRVLARVAERGWERDTDVFFTTDHGELQGDFGLLYKGPYHVDSLMRLPFVWRPALSAGVAPAEIAEPVGQLDLAPTFCAIARVPVPAWIEGIPLPTAPGSGRERVLTEWDGQFKQLGMHLRTIYRDGFVCTVYEPSTTEHGWDLARLYRTMGVDLPMPDVHYDGSEGELYDLRHDPLQWRNLWNDAGYAKRKSDLVADLYDHLPKAREPRLPVEAPA